jgi:hypothetical protein
MAGNESGSDLQSNDPMPEENRRILDLIDFTLLDLTFLIPSW